MADSKVSALAAVTTIADADDLYVAVSGASNRITGANARFALRPRYAKIVDQKAEGVNGGTFTSGAWRTRDLNTIQWDADSLVTVAANQITLDAGTYECRIHAPSYAVSRNRIRLRNVTDSTTVLTSASGQHCGSPASSDVWIFNRFTIAASKALEVQHICQNTSTTFGFGVSLGDTVAGAGVEVYTEAEFWLIG